MASKKTPARSVVYCNAHARPPLVVLKTLACPLSAGPADIAHATFALRAATSRKSSRDAPATESTIHVLPPSAVWATCPCRPLAHTVVPLTTARPRNSADVPLDCGSHCAASGVATRTTSKRAVSLLIRLASEIVDSGDPRIVVFAHRKAQEPDGYHGQNQRLRPVPLPIAICEP